MDDSSRDELNLLIGDYADNALSPVESTQLCERLRQDAAAVDHFVRSCYLHWQLFELSLQSALRTDALERPCDHRERVLQAAAPADQPATRARSRRTYSWAAMLVLAGSLSAIAAVGWRTLAPESVVAQVSEVSSDAAWGEGSSAPSPGALVRQGSTLTLRRGRLVATLVSGAKLVVQGPATLTMAGDNEIQLGSGRLTAIIPRQATGFRIETELGRFVDLGTEFTLNLTAEECQLYVFRGLVELQPRRADGGPLRVPEGRAVSYDARSGDVVVLPYDEEQRISP